MKKLIVGIVVAVVAVAGVLSTAGYVYAQARTPQAQDSQAVGMGMMGGRGPRGGNGSDQTGIAQDGLLHDEMVAAFAEKFGLTADELETRLEAGETMWDVASSQGMTAEAFQTLRTEVRTAVLDQAVKDGKITQEQADWMKTRGAGMGQGMGTGMGRGRMGGAGRGQNANPDCPYAPTATPQS
jgi:hypothetical protein